MPKFRFTNVNPHFAKPQQPTYFALNTEEVGAWSLNELGELEVWFKGVTESVLLQPKVLGEMNFNAVLKLLMSEFPDIGELQLDRSIA